MYNGIGLQTARGSATNGYVQANLSSVLLSRKRVEYNAEDDLRRMEAEINRKPNEDLLQHARKRAIEMRCVEFETLMEEKGFDEDETAKKVNDYRKLLLSQLESGELNLDDELDIKNSHAKMQYAKKGRDRMRDALGLAKDFVPGSSMEKMNKMDAVDAALAPVPPVDEKKSMLDTLKQMKKEKKKDKDNKRKRKRKESTSSSSSSSSDSDSDSSDSSSSDSSEDEKRKKKKTKKSSKKTSEKEIKKETKESDTRQKQDSKYNNREDIRDDKRHGDSRRDDRGKGRSPRHEGSPYRRNEREGRRRSPPRRRDSKSRSPRRRYDSSSPDARRREVKEEPLSEPEHSPSRKERRRSDSYSSDEGHKHGKMRSMVSKK